MRLVVMSDVHGNLPALTAVMTAIPEADGVIVAGDLCLDGPTPVEVFDRLMDAGWTLLLGNTDWDIVHPGADLKPLKAERARWAAEQLGAERVEAMGRLPLRVQVPGDGAGLLAVHANPLNLHEHLRPTMSDEELRPYLDAVDATILCFGHLHVPYVRPALGKLLIDVASVGHPKDLDTRSAFTVISWEEGVREVRQVRVPYDLSETARMLRASDMPGAEQQIEELYAATY